MPIKTSRLQQFRLSSQKDKYVPYYHYNCFVFLFSEFLIMPSELVTSGVKVERSIIKFTSSEEEVK